MRTGESVECFYLAGSLRKDKTIEEFKAEISRLGGQAFKHVIPSRQQPSEEWVYVWDRAGLALEHWSKNGGVTFNLRCVDQHLVIALKLVAETFIARKQTKGRVYVVTSGSDGPHLTEMGVAGEDFVPDNYAAHVVEDYRHVIQDLNAKDPCGFVTLLNGPPGTGKTHMVRAMMNEVPKATFILVPSNMIAALGSPDFLGLLIREQKKDSPLILIIEDADEAIVDRKEGSKSAISALLNFSDGIFGSMLNMRVVCTTNVKIDALDAAVMRDGRLCREINIDALDNIQANAIYERLTGKKGELKEKFYTLASIYSAAKAIGHTPKPEKPQKKMGFQLPTKEESLAALEEATPVYSLNDKGQPVFDGFLMPNGLVSGALPSVDDDDDLIDEDPDDDDDDDEALGNALGDLMTEDDDEDEDFDEDNLDTNPGMDWDDSEESGA